MSISSSAASHTFGPSCRLNPVTPLESADGPEGIPPLKAQFFYSSSIPIDDPLSAATIVGGSETKASKLPLRPFSPGDNTDLERAWLRFSSDRDRKNHKRVQKHPGYTPSLDKENAQKLAAIIAQLAAKHKEKHDREGQLAPAGELSDRSPCCTELLLDASTELRREFCALARRRQSLNHKRVVEGVMDQLSRMRRPASAGSSQAEAAPNPGVVQLSSSVGRTRSSSGTRQMTAFAASPDGKVAATTSAVIPARPPVLDDALSRQPFARVEPSPRRPASSRPTSSAGSRSRSPAPAETGPRITARSPVEALELGGDLVEIPVGISRLHKVHLPILQMRPIYWSPINDISVVLRATWFYKDTMTPVEPVVANQLEAGYRELQPWTETWKDELRSAIEVGPLGEEKVSHCLWPDHADPRSKTKDTGPSEAPISSDPFCAARCFQGEAAAEGTLEPVRPKPVESFDSAPEMPQPYSNYHVIYKDASDAYLLKPNLQPSNYYGRKPVSKIMKGLRIGIPVVRGFDWQVWQSIHEKKQSPKYKENTLSPPQTSSGTEDQHACPGCRSEVARGQVTDLVLVAHGIGQKLAERNESYHFTHAVNAFRRAVNVELENPEVKSVLRSNQNGIMVLPVNWRHLVSFEDGGPKNEEDKAAYAPDGFTLKDIEPGTIPVIRGIISDVMFDIPFYMSHHKPKMIAALVGEANRVYRLWCRNNPGFSEKGRVHLIGHSLGSAMAIEVLSRQPTWVPRLDLSCQIPEVRHFEFNTANLFLLGSPAGFFLLLERGGLVPRRGHMKPGADPADTVAKDVVGDVGLFGCIPVDNIYNILAKEDPIAYLLTGTIDPLYAASLKTAYVPSTTTSFFKSVGNAVRGMTGYPAAGCSAAGASRNTAADRNLTKPSELARLPSQLELDIHDFTREDIAEKKAYLLNDNGQLDYYLHSGGGPLEIQYLNMIGAHSSYWTHKDLIRLICVEVGRMPGRRHTLPSMRAVKMVKAAGTVRGTMLGGPRR